MSEGKLGSVPFAKFHFVPFVYSLKMPSDKRIEIRVGIGCDKGTSPINLYVFTIIKNTQHYSSYSKQTLHTGPEYT